MARTGQAPSASTSLIARRTASGSMFMVSGSTSANTGRAPTCSMTWMEEAKVSGVVTTASPGPIPRVARETWRAAVPELTAAAAGAPTVAANSSSNRWTRGPVVSQPERRAAVTSRISSSPTSGA